MDLLSDLTIILLLLFACLFWFTYEMKSSWVRPHWLDCQCSLAGPCRPSTRYSSGWLLHQSSFGLRAPVGSPCWKLHVISSEFLLFYLGDWVWIGFSLPFPFLLLSIDFISFQAGSLPCTHYFPCSFIHPSSPVK